MPWIQDARFSGMSQKNVGWMSWKIPIEILAKHLNIPREQLCDAAKAASDEAFRDFEKRAIARSLARRDQQLITEHNANAGDSHEAQVPPVHGNPDPKEGSEHRAGGS